MNFMLLPWTSKVSPHHINHPPKKPTNKPNEGLSGMLKAPNQLIQSKIQNLSSNLGIVYKDSCDAGRQVETVFKTDKSAALSMVGTVLSMGVVIAAGTLALGALALSSAISQLGQAIKFAHHAMAPYVKDATQSALDLFNHKGIQRVINGSTMVLQRTGYVADYLGDRYLTGYQDIKKSIAFSATAIVNAGVDATTTAANSALFKNINAHSAGSPNYSHQDLAKDFLSITLCGLRMGSRGLGAGLHLAAGSLYFVGCVDFIATPIDKLGGLFSDPDQIVTLAKEFYSPPN